MSYNILTNRYPSINNFVNDIDFNEKHKIYTFAIGSNNNIADWKKFLQTNINKAEISDQKKLSTINVSSFEKCLNFINEGILDNYYLTFSSYSYKRGGQGIACIKECKDCTMHGGIFELVSNDIITKKNIINLIRWKEDFPTLYNELILPIRTKENKIYNCLIYNINNLEIELNNTFPHIPYPPSNYYIDLVCYSHGYFNFNSTWLYNLNNVINCTKNYRIRINNNIKNLYKLFNDDFTLITFIKSNYNNTNYRAFIKTKDNNFERFKIYTLLACQYLLYFIQKNPIQNDIYNIISSMNRLEYIHMYNLLELLSKWDIKIKAYQQQIKES